MGQKFADLMAEPQPKSSILWASRVLRELGKIHGIDEIKIEEMAQMILRGRVSKQEALMEIPEHLRLMEYKENSANS